MAVSEGHECPVEGCEVYVSRDHLLCRDHWFTVPKALRQKVWRAWHRWQSGKADLQELLEAQQEAIAAADEAAKQESIF